MNEAFADLREAICCNDQARAVEIWAQNRYDAMMREYMKSHGVDLFARTPPWRRPTQRRGRWEGFSSDPRYSWEESLPFFFAEAHLELVPDVPFEEFLILFNKYRRLSTEWYDECTVPLYNIVEGFTKRQVNLARNLFHTFLGTHTQHIEPQTIRAAIFRQMTVPQPTGE